MAETRPPVDSTPPMDKDTVSIHFAAAAVARLAPPARRRVLAASGIAEEWLQQPRARVPAASFAALWMAVAHEIDDEFFGLDRRRMKVGSFALLCHAALAAPTLEMALRQMLRGFSVFLDDVQSSFELAGPDVVVKLDNRIADADARRFADETLLVMIHGLLCWLAGRRIALRGVAFAWPRPPHAGEYLAMFSEHLSFDAPATTMRFGAALLAQPPAQDAAALKAFLRTAPQSVFLRYRNESGWTARVRRILRRHAGHASWPVLEELAAELQVAPTTLRRRLDAEGSSVQAIKDQLRRDLAIHHLSRSALGVADIAALVGFQEPSAFHRAFKRWTGVQPGEYRLRRAQGTPG